MSNRSIICLLLNICLLCVILRNLGLSFGLANFGVVVFWRVHFKETFTVLSFTRPLSNPWYFLSEFFKVYIIRIGPGAVFIPVSTNILNKTCNVNKSILACCEPPVLGSALFFFFSSQSSAEWYRPTRRLCSGAAARTFLLHPSPTSTPNPLDMSSFCTVLHYWRCPQSKDEMILTCHVCSARSRRAKY